MTYYAKLWTDILDDPKLIRAARQGAKQLVYLPWLIAYAKRADDDGRLSIAGLPAEPIDIARSVPGGVVKHVAESMQWLTSIGILVPDDDGALRFIAWRRRNWMAPSDTADQVRDRVARHRAKRRGETPRATEDVTTTETSTVTTGVTTARSRDVDEDVDRDKDKDRDKDEDAASPAARETAIAAQLTTDAGRNALTAIVSRAPVKDAWIQEIHAALTGMHGTQLTPAQLDEALREYVGNGAFTRMNFRTFRNYLRVAGQEPVEVASGSGGHRRDYSESASFTRDLKPGRNGG